MNLTSNQMQVMVMLCYLLIIVYPLDLVKGKENQKVQIYTFATFPQNEVALHMPCEESNMFATKCMCHLRCTSPKCDNAIRLCEKYSASKGCRYLIMRGGANNKFATIKRVPTEAELSRFNISGYAHTMAALQNNPRWKSLQSAISSSSVPEKRKSFQNMISTLGEKGDELLKRIFQPRHSHKKHCPMKYHQNSTAFSLREKDREEFLKDGISLVALSYKAPRTLLNSMKTWQSSGLLDIVTEKILILNDPTPEEYSIALEFGFRVVEPKTIPDAKMAKPNVVTIGAAFYYALQLITTDYLLFLENDFKMDIDLPKGKLEAELLVGAGLLQSGVQLIRLQSRKYQGCGTFKDCDHHGIHLTASAASERTRNWFAFYCKGRPHSDPHVSDCFEDPDYRCFTSWDTNWSLNAALVKKSTMLSIKYPINKLTWMSIPEIAISQYEKQDGLESIMVYGYPWQEWRVPLCISYNGLFINEEIETGA